MAFKHYLEEEDDKPYFTTNSLGYYYDKMEGFAEKVEQAAKVLNVTKEEVEKNITAYIEQNKNELDQRLAQWDGKLETFDSSVETLLTEWVDDGTLTPLIDSTLIDQKIAPVAEKLAEKVGGGKKAEPEDISDRLLAMVTGNGTVNVLSIPQPESVNLPQLNSGITKWGGHEAYVNSSTSSLYIATMFNATGLSVAVNTQMRLEFELYTEDSISTLSVRNYMNNNPVLTDITTYSSSATTIPYTGGFKKIVVEKSNNFIYTPSNYGYVRPYLVFTIPEDVRTYKKFFIRNIRLFVGDTELPLMEVGKYTNADAVSYVKTTDNAPLLLASKKDIPKKLSQLENDMPISNITKISQLADDVGMRLKRWNGKKANFIGTSITRGAESIDGVWTTVSKPYHQHLKDLLGLSIARNYGVNSTSVSTKSDYTDNSQCMLNRFAGMDNDADLIVAELPTNDFGHNTPLGSMADTTDISFYGAMDVLSRGLIEKYPGKRIVYLAGFHRNRSGDNNETNAIGVTLSQYIQAVIDKGRQHSIPVVDGYALNGLNPLIPIIKTTYMPDGLHFNDLGHELMAKNLAGQFEII